MRKFHHLGIPTSVPRPGEYDLPEHKVHVVDYGANPYGIEWMRYDPDCALPELVKTVPHLAFEVDDLEAEIAGKEILIAPNSPSPGVRVAFIVSDGAPVEFLQFTAAEAPGLARGSVAAVLARGFEPRASGEPKARPLTKDK